MHKRRTIDLHDLQRGPIQHAVLAPELIERIKAYKAVIGDADPASLEDAIDDFRRDRNPEKEVRVWERIAHVFHHFAIGHRVRDWLRRMHVLSVLLVISTGASLPEKTELLTRDQISELRYNF